MRLDLHEAALADEIAADAERDAQVEAAKAAVRERLGGF